MLRIIESSHGGGWSPTDWQQQDPCERTVPQVRACRVGGHCCSGQGCRAPSGCGDRKYKHPSDQEMDPGNPSLLISETGGKQKQVWSWDELRRPQFQKGRSHNFWLLYPWCLMAWAARAAEMTQRLRTVAALALAQAQFPALTWRLINL